jgi:hypothetical protein
MLRHVADRVDLGHEDIPADFKQRVEVVWPYNFKPMAINSLETRRREIYDTGSHRHARKGKEFGIESESYDVHPHVISHAMVVLILVPGRPI